MAMMAFIKRFLESLLRSDQDPIVVSKRMIGSIQTLVGIHNVFGDDERSVSLPSLFALVLFGGAFLYVGIFSQCIYLAQVFPDKLETFQAMNCISATLIPLSKYIFMWTSRSRIRAIFKISQQGLSFIPADTNGKAKLMATLQRGRYASWVVIVNLTVTHALYVLVPFLFTAFGYHRYLPTTPGEAYGLSPKYETPFYQITFVLTSLATAFSAISQTGYIVLFITLLVNELGHFYAITEALNDIHNMLSDNENVADGITDIIDVKLKSCIRHYQFLIKYHNRMRELYKVIFCAHFLMMTIVLVTTLQTMNSWDMRNTLLTAVTSVMPLFLYCFGGEMLITAGLELSAAVYACGWQFMNLKQAKVVLLMLCMTQRPLYLTAADLFIMNRATFGKVAQAVYKIYAVFN